VTDLLDGLVAVLAADAPNVALTARIRPSQPRSAGELLGQLYAATLLCRVLHGVMTTAPQSLPVGLAYLLFPPLPWAFGSLRQLLTLPETLGWAGRRRCLRHLQEGVCAAAR
jgi:hypothetical protein